MIVYSHAPMLIVLGTFLAFVIWRIAKNKETPIAPHWSGQARDKDNIYNITISVSGNVCKEYVTDQNNEVVLDVKHTYPDNESALIALKRKKWSWQIMNTNQ